MRVYPQVSRVCMRMCAFEQSPVVTRDLFAQYHKASRRLADAAHVILTNKSDIPRKAATSASKAYTDGLDTTLGLEQTNREWWDRNALVGLWLCASIRKQNV